MILLKKKMNPSVTLLAAGNEEHLLGIPARCQDHDSNRKNTLGDRCRTAKKRFQRVTAGAIYRLDTWNK